MRSARSYGSTPRNSSSWAGRSAAAGSFFELCSRPWLKRWVEITRWVSESIHFLGVLCRQFLLADGPESGIPTVKRSLQVVVEHLHADLQQGGRVPFVQ